MEMVATRDDYDDDDYYYDNDDDDNDDNCNENDDSYDMWHFQWWWHGLSCSTPHMFLVYRYTLYVQQYYALFFWQHGGSYRFMMGLLMKNNIIQAYVDVGDRW